MLKAGITGGIGSGKTTVCRLFELIGIPVFYADEEARKIMDTDPALVAAISSLFGRDIYKDQTLDRKRLGEIVFNAPDKLAQLNALVHPATIEHADQWMAARQNVPYALKEAAIFFESNSHLHMDVMIGVDAPEDIRIERVIRRNHISREEVLQRMARQMNNEEKMSRCDYVIMNDDRHALIPQVLQLHETLKARSIASAIR